MLYSGKKFALCATKKINILTLVLSQKIFLNEKQKTIPPPPPPPPPPFKLNGRSLSVFEKRSNKYLFLIRLSRSKFIRFQRKIDPLSLGI